MCKAVPLAWQVCFILKWLHLYYYLQNPMEYKVKLTRWGEGERERDGVGGERKNVRSNLNCKVILVWYPIRIRNSFE